MYKLLWLLFCVAIISCKDEPPPQEEHIVGRWIGGTQELSVDITLTRNDKTISGNGYVTLNGDTPKAATSNGSVLYPNVSLTIYITGYNPLAFNGTFNSSKVIVGTINGSGINNMQINLYRD